MRREILGPQTDQLLGIDAHRATWAPQPKMTTANTIYSAPCSMGSAQGPQLSGHRKAATRPTAAIRIRPYRP